MAALEVVKSRLDDVGLGEFCLELHSRKSNKKEVLQELERSLNQSSISAVDYEDVCAELDLLRSDLNTYAQALRETIGKKGLNAIEAVCDSVIELSSTDEEGEYQRKLRIKKMKRKHIERWIDFRVDGDKGIIFGTRNSKKIK